MSEIIEIAGPASIEERAAAARQAFQQNGNEAFPYLLGLLSGTAQSVHVDPLEGLRAIIDALDNELLGSKRQG